MRQQLTLTNPRVFTAFVDQTIAMADRLRRSITWAIWRPFVIPLVNAMLPKWGEVLGGLRDRFLAHGDPSRFTDEQLDAQIRALLDMHRAFVTLARMDVEALHRDEPRIDVAAVRKTNRQCEELLPLIRDELDVLRAEREARLAEAVRPTTSVATMEADQAISESAAPEVRQRDDYEAEGPELRAKLDAACRPWDETRKAHKVSLDDLFGPN